MARSISKKVNSATIYVLDPSKSFEVDDNGMPKANVTIEVDGAPTDNKARIIAQKECGSKNVMVLDVVIDTNKLTVSPDVFRMHSSVCVEGETYGREYVTQEFKITYIDGFYMSDEGMQPFSTTYNGVTTDSKLLNYAREVNNNTAIITNKRVETERRYMTREKYIELGK